MILPVRAIAPARAWVFRTVLAAICLTLAACCDQSKQTPDGIIVRNEPPPSAEEIARIYNPTVEHLDRLWARTELRIQGVDDDGKDFDETAEGHLQFIRPAMVSLTVKKVGETYFALGSNQDRYWWMDLRKPRTAFIGSLANASPKAVARFGVPVHPLDLVDLLGVLPIDPAGASTAWSEDGAEIVMSLPGRWGTRILRFRPEDAALVCVQLLDSHGEIVCESRITQTEPVEFRDTPDLKALAPTRLTLTLPARATTVTVALHDPQNRGSAMQQAPFNPDALLRAYNIAPADVRSLDIAP